MKILKIIVIFFVIYFIRRFIQVYRAMKKIQEAQAAGQDFTNNTSQSSQDSKIINADFKVVD